MCHFKWSMDKIYSVDFQIKVFKQALHLYMERCLFCIFSHAKI